MSSPHHEDSRLVHRSGQPGFLPVKEEVREQVFLIFAGGSIATLPLRQGNVTIMSSLRETAAMSKRQFARSIPAQKLRP
jgi:hypothetical protein